MKNKKFYILLAIVPFVAFAAGMGPTPRVSIGQCGGPNFTPIEPTDAQRASYNQCYFKNCEPESMSLEKMLGRYKTIPPYECAYQCQTEACKISAAPVRSSTVKQQNKPSNLCKDFPHSVPILGGCKCEEGYTPSKIKNACVTLEEAKYEKCETLGIHHAIYDAESSRCNCQSGESLSADGKQCLPLAAREAYDAIQEAKALLVKAKENYVHVSIFQEAEDKIKQAEDDYDKQVKAGSTDYSVALGFAREAKNIILNIEDIHSQVNKARCSYRAFAVNQGGGRVDVDISNFSPATDGCDCHDFTLDIVGYTRSNYGLFFNTAEKSTLLASAPACDVQGDGYISVVKSSFLLDIDIDKSSGRRNFGLPFGLNTFLYQRFSRIEGQLRPNDQKAAY